jgi:hypothetical protein
MGLVRDGQRKRVLNKVLLRIAADLTGQGRLRGVVDVVERRFRV